MDCRGVELKQNPLEGFALTQAGSVRGLFKWPYGDRERCSD